MNNEWIKSSFSGPGNCVEVKFGEWVKSSFSGANGACVETNFSPEGSVSVRDSKDPDGAVLLFTREEWEAFIAGVENKEFNIPT